MTGFLAAGPLLLPGGVELLLIVALVVLLFGGKFIPPLTRRVGEVIEAASRSKEYHDRGREE